MNKKELIKAIAEKANLTATQAEAALAATFGTIQDALSGKDNVSILGFGSFATKVREERNGRNPATGEAITIPKATVPVFKPAAQLKESVNQDKRE